MGSRVQAQLRAHARSKVHTRPPDYDSRAYRYDHDPRAYHYDLTPDYDPRYPDPYFGESEERSIRSTPPYAPTFDGCQDPVVYIDWEDNMDYIFEWNKMSELEKIKLARCKLTRLAQWEWKEIKFECDQRREEIFTWKNMRSRLREKYLGRFYEKRLLDQWYQLKQDDQTVSEYIDQFNYYIRKCNTVEPKSKIISRFRDGLCRDIQWELFHEKIYDLDDAYQLARELESYQREPMNYQVEPSTPLDPISEKIEDPEIHGDSTDTQCLGHT